MNSEGCKFSLEIVAVESLVAKKLTPIDYPMYLLLCSIIPGGSVGGSVNLIDMQQDEYIGSATEVEGVVAIVDDEAGVRKMLSRGLQLEGFSCRPFASGQDFLDSLEHETPDCVILDLRMPGLDGLDVLQRMPENARGIAVLMFSSHGTIPDAVQAIHTGAIDFVEKPILIHDLTEKIRDAIAHSKTAIASIRQAGESEEFFNRLTDREKTVAREVYQGLTGTEIAAKLEISPRTVEVHRTSIMKKMEARNLADLVRILGTMDHQP